MPSGVEATGADLAAVLVQAARTAGANDPQVHGADWQTAVVTAVNSDGTVNIGTIRARRLDAYLNAAVGDLIQITQNGAKNWIALGRLAPVVDTEWTTYAPIVTNGGAATFTTRAGFYKKIGKLVFVNTYIVVNAVGTGSATVSVTMPSVVDRTNRQILTMHTETIGAAGNAISHAGGGECIFFPTGTGATSDRLRTDQGGTTAQEGNIQGVDLLAGGSITIQGWYREA
ncbi:hypothetical protein ACFU76_04430 [Streptomyces sp. NPDC057539]|uniref:hypothetical protein n=1 Tax=Streptomyces sp. NPDC057539 TaxID=3346159 RepID=UPI00369A28F7